MARGEALEPGAPFTGRGLRECNGTCVASVAEAKQPVHVAKLPLKPGDAPDKELHDGVGGLPARKSHTKAFARWDRECH